MSRFLYLDIENIETVDNNSVYGSPVYKKEIVQLSYIYSLNGKIHSYEDLYFRSINKYDQDTVSVHGLSKRKVDAMACGNFNAAVPKLRNLINMCTHIVGHNISYDLGVIMNEGNVELNSLISQKPMVCTMKNYVAYASKTIANEKRGVSISWASLTELVSILMNRKLINYEDMVSDYRCLTGKEPRSHDAMWDTYVCYRCHEVLRKLDEC